MDELKWANDLNGRNCNWIGEKIENNLIGVRTNRKPINEYDLNKIGHFTFLSSVSQYFNGSHLSCIFDQAHFRTPNWANLIESKPQNVHWFDWMWNFLKNCDAVTKLSSIWSEFCFLKNILKNRFKLSRCLPSPKDVFNITK